MTQIFESHFISLTDGIHFNFLTLFHNVDNYIKIILKKKKRTERQPKQFVRVLFYLCHFFQRFQQEKKKRKVQNDSIILIITIIFFYEIKP